MSSLRNAIRRKVHKERQQPAARARVGFLEKKKDYKERAVDHHRKEDEIKRLREKAALRNPDEYYFGMNSAKTKDGVHQLGGAKQHSAAEQRKMTDQDLAYLKRKRDKERKRIEALQSSLHCLVDGAAANKHTVFVGSAEEVKEFRPDEYFDTAPELVSRAYNRPRRAALARPETAAALPSGREAKRIEKSRRLAYEELAARLKRKRKLTGEVESLQTRKNLMGKGKRTKIVRRDKFGDEIEEATQYKWDKIRKK